MNDEQLIKEYYILSSPMAYFPPLLLETWANLLFLRGRGVCLSTHRFIPLFDPFFLIDRSLQPIICEDDQELSAPHSSNIFPTRNVDGGPAFEKKVTCFFFLKKKTRVSDNEMVVMLTWRFEFPRLKVDSQKVYNDQFWLPFWNMDPESEVS